MSNEKIKSCPFCGSRKVGFFSPEDYSTAPKIVCWDCRAEGPDIFLTDFNSNDTEEMKRVASELWNNRVSIK